MKILVFSLLLFLSAPDNNVSSSYCEGWEVGYCEGWRDIKGDRAICPLTPFCPYPEYNRNTYKHGYHRGFKAGIKAANK